MYILFFHFLLNSFHIKNEKSIFKLNYLYIIIKKGFSKIITKCIICEYHNEYLEIAILLNIT